MEEYGDADMSSLVDRTAPAATRRWAVAHGAAAPGQAASTSDADGAPAAETVAPRAGRSDGCPARLQPGGLLGRWPTC